MFQQTFENDYSIADRCLLRRWRAPTPAACSQETPVLWAEEEQEDEDEKTTQEIEEEKRKDKERDQRDDSLDRSNRKQTPRRGKNKRASGKLAGLSQ